MLREKRLRYLCTYPGGCIANRQRRRAPVRQLRRIDGYGSISNCVQRKPRTRNMVVKSAKRIDTNPPKPCARCREADCTCVRSTSFPPRRRRKVETPNHGRAAQARQPALPRESSERPLYDIDQLGIGPLAAAMFWRMELARSEAALKAAKLRRKFAKGKYEEALAECLAADNRSTDIEPKAKRKKNGHSRNGNGKARTGTVYDDEI
ncbi:hypothetical protein EI94DRAFT_1046199 [Lactarius quietus]|nr:hypothetical protein EI94DRAFT_1046199 [Lactarius quietus]